ncbi:hypothetical protein [Spiroplasma endosymbiont of Seladonia tumulorum]
MYLLKPFFFPCDHKDTIVGKDKKSACLTLTEELTKFTFLKN